MAASYHSYVPPGAVAVNVADDPEQMDVPAAVGAAGMAFTVMETVAGGLVHPPTVTVKVYVPLMAAVALVIAGGFLTPALYPFGPVQL